MKEWLCETMAEIVPNSSVVMELSELEPTEKRSNSLNTTRDRVLRGVRSRVKEDASTPSPTLKSHNLGQSMMKTDHFTHLELSWRRRWRRRCRRCEGLAARDSARFGGECSARRIAATSLKVVVLRREWSRRRRRAQSHGNLNVIGTSDTHFG